jgi:integrase
MARKIENGKVLEAMLKPGAKPGRYPAGEANLHLKVGRGDAQRSWTYFYRWQGKMTEHGLGSAFQVSLTAARTAARACRAQLDQGIKPGTQEGAEADASPLFGTVADAVIAAKAKGWKGDGGRKRWTYALSRRRDADGELDGTGFCTKLVGKPCNAITEADVLGVLSPIWLSKSKSAALLRTMIEAVLHAGGRRGADNPATLEALRHSLPKQPAEVRHCPALDYKAAPEFMARLRACGRLGARPLEFAVLTWTRTDETRVALRSEIDLESALWVVPAHRTKKNREHRIPLSPRALEIIAELDRTRPEGNPYLFPGKLPGQPISRSPMADTLHSLGIKTGEASVHGMRSMGRDWAGECTAHPHDICEAALAHARKDKTHAAYQRGDLLAKRAKLMTDWSRYLDAKPVAATKGLQLRRVRRLMVRKPAPALSIAA